MPADLGTREDILRRYGDAPLGVIRYDLNSGAVVLSENEKVVLSGLLEEREAGRVIEVPKVVPNFDNSKSSRRRRTNKKPTYEKTKHKHGERDVIRINQNRYLIDELLNERTDISKYGERLRDDLKKFLRDDGQISLPRSMYGKIENSVSVEAVAKKLYLREEHVAFLVSQGRLKTVTAVIDYLVTGESFDSLTLTRLDRISLIGKVFQGKRRREMKKPSGYFGGLEEDTIDYVSEDYVVFMDLGDDD